MTLVRLIVDYRTTQSSHSRIANRASLNHRALDSLYLSFALSAASFIPLAAFALRSLARSIIPDTLELMPTPPILNMEVFMPLNMDEFMAPRPPPPPLPVRRCCAADEDAEEEAG